MARELKILLSPMAKTLGSLVTSVLNARGRFAASAIAPIVYNLAIIGAALTLTSTFGVTGLALGDAKALYAADGRIWFEDFSVPELFTVAASTPWKPTCVKAAMPRK